MTVNSVKIICGTSRGNDPFRNDHRRHSDATTLQSGCNEALDHMLGIALLFKRNGLFHPIDYLRGLGPAAGSYFFGEDIDKNIEVMRSLLLAVRVSIGSSEKGRQIDSDIRQRSLQGRFKEFVILPLNKICKGTIGIVSGVAVRVQAVALDIGTKGRAL